jgi:hypothetical protein
LEGNVHDNVVIGLYHRRALGRRRTAVAAFTTGPGQQPGTTATCRTVTGGLVGELPSGGGVLVLGWTPSTSATTNQNNNFFGIAMIDYCIAVDGTDNSCQNNPPFYSDTSPDGNRFIDNEITGNGSDPPPGPFEAVAGDFLGLGGTNNCASGNVAPNTILSPELPEC